MNSRLSKGQALSKNISSIDTERKPTPQSWKDTLSKSIYSFFTEPTARKSQRENYYQYSNYLAEYWCTLSNLGLLAVGCYYGDFATIAAATFSALSHAIPLQRLHDLDILGVAGVLGKVIANYEVISKRTDVIATGAAALTLNLIDTVVTRKHLDKVGPYLHVAWHIAAAIALGKLNQAQLDAETNYHLSK